MKDSKSDPSQLEGPGTRQRPATGRRRFSFGLLLLLTAVPLAARSNVTVNKAEGFDPTSLGSVAVVVSDCHEVVDCQRVEHEAAEALGVESQLTVRRPSEIQSWLLGQGATAYSADEHRGPLIEHFDLGAVIELRIPFAERGDGFGGDRRSSIKLEMFVLDGEGRILVHGVGTRRPKNVVSGPEKVLGKLMEEMAVQAFGRR